MDPLGHLLALAVTPADEEDWEQVGLINRGDAGGVEEPVKAAFVDQGYTGDKPMEAVAQNGSELWVVKHPQAKRGFVLLPRRLVVKRSFAWPARFRRLAQDYERLATTFAGYHWRAFITLMLGTLFAKS